MSEESTPTRQETVEANISAVVAKYGEENWARLLSVCLQDISVSLAMLVDTDTSSSTSEET